MNILVLMVALATLYSVDALKCKACVYMEGSSDNDVMKMILDAMTKASSGDCEGDAGDAIDQECGNLPPGHDQFMCGKGDVQTSLTQVSGGQTLRADLRVVTRGCAPVKTSEERYSVGCHPASEFKDMISAGFGGNQGQGGEGPSMGDLSGEFCLCEGHNCNGAVGHSPLVLLVLALTSLVFFLKQ